MNIKKFFGRTLCALVLSLAGCMSHPHYSPSNIKQPMPPGRELETPIAASPEKPRRLKAWQYPVNIVGGYLTHILAHESGHALAALAQGVGIEEFHPYPGFINGEFRGGWVRYNLEDYRDTSSEQRAIMSIAGPVGDIALAETINYNLRNGNISPAYQPFWATTSLMSRGGLFFYAIQSLGDNTTNDFTHLEIHTDIPKETWIGLVGLYTAFSAKKIAKEFRVALGRDSYRHGPERKGELSLIPVNNGLGLTYSLKF